MIEKRIRQILKANSMYTISDAMGRIEYANEKFCKTLDINAGTLIGERLQLSNSEIHSNRKVENIWSTISQGEEWSGELTHKLNNGKLVWLKTAIFPIKDTNDDDFKFLSTYEDITKLKSENEKVKNDEAMYKSIYKSVKIGIIIVTDHNGTIIKWNQGAEKVFGYSESEILGQPLSVLMVEKYKKLNIADFLKLIERHKTSKNVNGTELKWLKKANEEFSVELVISAWNLNGKKHYFLKMLDITKRIAFQNRLTEKTNELELLLYRSAHDLTAPFSSAQGLINLIKEEQSIEEIQIYIGMLEKTINHAKVLSEGLSSASQITTQSKNLKVIDFSLIVDSVLKKLSGNTKYEHIKFNIVLKNSDGFISNPDLLFGVFKNLIQNAIKYSLPPSEHHKPYIDIKVTSLADEIVIIICDNGKGIAKKEFNKIFELYYRTEKEHHLGFNGLGLYVVKNSIESLNGKISVNSKINLGACFVINLPRTIYKK